VRVFWLVVLVGCGRFGFDAVETTDAGAGLPDAPEMVGVFRDQKLPPGGHVRALALQEDFQLANYYVAYSGGRIFRVDNGAWTECAPLAGEPYDIAVDDAGTLYATTKNDDLAYSADRCASFSVVTPPTLAFALSGAPTGVFTGGYDGVWSYTPGGTFTRVTSPFDGLAIFEIVYGSGGRVGVSASGLFGVRIGTTWYTTNIGANGSYRIIFDPTNANIVYSLTESDIYRSTDGGMTFTVFKNGFYDVFGIDPANTQRFLAMAGGGLEQTLDAYANWQDDVRDAVTGKGWPSEIIFDPAGTGRVLMATETGVYTAADASLAWQRIDTGVDAWWVDAVAESSTAVYAGTSGVLFVSEAGGPWQQRNSINAQSSAIYGLTVSSTSPDRVYATGDALELSPDRGATFSTVLPSSQTDGWSFYEAAEQGTRLWAASYSRLTYSDNGGPFTAANLGGSHLMHDLLVRGTDVIAASSDGVYWSIDNGVSFQQSNMGLLDIDLRDGLVALPDSRIAIGNSDGAWATTARGATWTRIGFAGHRVNDLLVTPSNAIVAAVDNGVFVSTNAGSTWTELDGLSTYRPWSLAIGQNNTLLVGTQGRGLFRTALP
jgi:hypothetical protein